MDYLTALARWEELVKAIAHMKTEERALREGLFAGTFPNPTEGSNSYTLPDGRIVKGTYKINRKLDEDALAKVLKKLKMARRDAPIRTKLELDLSAYREMDEADRKVFDGALEVKPVLPTLEVVYPEAVAAAVSPA